MRPLGPPPDERPNYAKLNEGQRRYAWEQYRLAQIRRGISIDHPIPEGGQHADGHPDIEQLLAGGEEASEDAQREAIENFDESHFESVSEGNSEGSNNQRSSEANIGPMADSTVTAGPSGVAGKRKNEEQGGGKRARQGGSNKLPGTALEQGQTQGMEGGPRAGPIVHPSRSLEPSIRFYRKVHRFLSFGFAYKPTRNTLPGPPIRNQIFMTTPLMNIPVDWLYLYMNPSEYSLLPRGAHAIRCNVKVIQRNVRVAFPTNSTANNLATLNQNKNIVYSIGLNKKIEGRNSVYNGFQADQPMVVTNIERVTETSHTAIMTEMYNNDTNIVNTMPRHQFGQPQILNIYYTPVYFENPATDTPEDGWQCFQQAVEELDADSSTGNEIVDYNYHFSVGLIRQPKLAITRAFRATPTTLTIPRGSHNLDAHSQTVTIDNVGQPQNSVSSLTVESVVPYNTNLAFLNNVVQPIEKSQWLHEGIMTKPIARTQESLHVGVQPTYALTSTALMGDSNQNFTDTQAYFEVICDLEVNTNYSTFRPLTGISNTYVNNLWMQNTTLPALFEPLLDGMLQNRTVD